MPGGFARGTGSVCSACGGLGNLDNFNLQNESVFACAFDVDNNLVGWVFNVIEDSAGEDDPAIVSGQALKLISTTGVVTVPYDPVASNHTLEDCPECNNCIFCTPESVTYVASDNYSAVDPGLLAIASADQTLQVLEFTAEQLQDFNMDMVGNVGKDPSATPPPFDGRVVRIGQVNLRSLFSSCFEDGNIVTLTATLIATRDSEDGVTIVEDGSLIIANQATDTFLSTANIPAGNDGVVTVTTSFLTVSQEIEAGDIVLLVALQTQDASLPDENGVNWTNVRVDVSATTLNTCEEVEAERVVDCDNDRRDALLSEIRDRVTPSWVTNAEGVTDNDTVTGIGSTASGLYKVAFYNSGGTTVTVDGGPLIPGVGFTHTGYHDPTKNLFVRLPAIPYDATGGSLQIVIQE